MIYFFRDCDPVDLAFDVIRDLLIQNKNEAISVDSIYQKCHHKGLGDAIVNECIKRYDAMGTIQLDSNGKFLQSLVN